MLLDFTTRAPKSGRVNHSPAGSIAQAAPLTERSGGVVGQGIVRFNNLRCNFHTTQSHLS